MLAVAVADLRDHVAPQALVLERQRPHVALACRPDRDRVARAEATCAALPPGVSCIVIQDFSPFLDERSLDGRDPVAALLEAMDVGLREQSDVAVIVLGHNDAAAWVAGGSLQDADFRSTVLAAASLASGLAASIPPPNIATRTDASALDDSTTLTSLVSGHRSTLRDLLAKLEGPVLLSFWADWCQPCIQEMPELKRLHEEYGTKVNFIGLANGRAQNPRLRALLAQKGIAFPNHAFLEQALYMKLVGSEMQLPTLALLDSSRNLVHVVIGSVTQPAALASLERRLEDFNTTAAHAAGGAVP